MDALACTGDEGRGTLRLGDPVVQIETLGDRATGVACASGWRSDTDAVACNADIMHSYRDLLATSRSAQRTRARLERKRYSPSLFVVHFRIKGTWPGIPHHMILFGPRYKGLLEDIYDHGEAVGRAGACCAGRDIRDARAVCDRMGIAHYVFDHETRFRESVVDRFADEYLAGRTPIPCVQCNTGPKFTDLLQMARDLGADCLATGHYVRRMAAPNGAELHRGADPARLNKPVSGSVIAFSIISLSCSASAAVIRARFVTSAATGSAVRRRMARNA